MTSEKESVELSKEEFQKALASSYADIAKETKKVNDLSNPTGGRIQIDTDEGLKDVAEYEQITLLKYKNLKEWYNEREGLTEGIAEFIETKLEDLDEPTKQTTRATILDSLTKGDIPEAMDDVLGEHAAARFFGGIKKSGAKKLFLDNAEDAVSGSNLGRLTKLIDNAISTAKDPSVTLAPVDEVVAMSIGDNHDSYPHLKDAMLDSLKKKLGAEFKKLETGKSAEQLNHLKDSIIDSLNDGELDKLLGYMAKKNAWFGADAKDIKEAQKQLMDNDRFLEGIVSKAVSDGREREREDRIAAGEETRDVDLSSPDNTFLKTALFGMMLTASAIQGYNYISQHAPSPRAPAPYPDDSKPLAIGSSNSSTTVSLANQGTSSDLRNSVAPGPGAMVTSAHADALRAVDASNATGMALTEPSIPLGMSPLPGTGTMVRATPLQSPAVTDTTVALTNAAIGTSLPMSPIPASGTMVRATPLQSPDVTDTTVASPDAAIGTSLPMSPIPASGTMVRATPLRSPDVTDTTVASPNAAIGTSLPMSPAPGPGAVALANQRSAPGSGVMVTSSDSNFFGDLRTFAQAFVQNPNEIRGATKEQKAMVLTYLQRLAADGQAQTTHADRNNTESQALVKTSQIGKQNQQIISGFSKLSTQFLQNLSVADQQQFIPVFRDLGSTLTNLSKTGNLFQLLGGAANNTTQLMIADPSTASHNVSVISLATQESERGISAIPGPDAMVPYNATALRAGAGVNVTDISLANADGLTPRISPIPGSDSLVTSAHATDLRAANTLDSVKVDTVAPISHATTLPPKSPTVTLDSIRVDTAPGSQQQSPTATHDSVRVSPTATPSASQIAPLDAIQVSSSAPTVQAPKAKASKKLRKPILSPYDTFAAHNETTGWFTRTHEDRLEKLHKLKAELGRLAKDTPDFIKKQFAVTKAENFLRKGRETGGDYKEHQLAVLDEKAARSKSTKEDKQRAAEYRIALANSRIDALDSSLNNLADEMKSSSTNKTKILAAYKSAAASIVVPFVKAVFHFF